MDGWIAFKLLRNIAVAFTTAFFVVVAFFCLSLIGEVVVVTVWLDSMEFGITKAALNLTELPEKGRNRYCRYISDSCGNFVCIWMDGYHIIYYVTSRLSSQQHSLLL